MGITIKDIARMAGVSAMTVSNVINNRVMKTSKETRDHILSLIEEYDYKPNAFARGLVNGKTNTIGLILPDISNPFFSCLIRGIEDAANKAGYSVLLCNSYNSLEKEKQYINALKETGVDGIIFASSTIRDNDMIAEMARTSFPVVMVDRFIDGQENIYSVFVDSFKGAYRGVKHLIELGHQHIGCITGPLSSMNSSEQLRGYKEAMGDAGLKIEKPWIFSGKYDMESGVSGAEQMLVTRNKVTAIMACGDIMAYGVYRKANSLKLEIPNNLSVVGFDDIPFSNIITPTLTTIRHPVYEMSDRATKILFGLLKGNQIDQKLYCYDTELIVRESTKRF